ncbi:uncharacterized protein VTP21DRAFT_6469 [Calcarisporiella thermophila]|uniref:uncharacterized protein n=1 Tax=Calcarisporiella thermophila TaxID=911321 RepID=UPI003743C413
MPNESAIQHPYYPRNAIISNYTPNTLSMSQCLAGIGVPVLITMVAGYLMVRDHPKVQGVHRAIFLWFAVCGLIHFVLEGYFGVFHSTMAGDQTFLGQLWKEYAHGDSRYLTSDSFVVNMERITALFWGPLSYLCCYAIYSNKPYRHIVQLVVSLGQLYGCVLYFATTLFEGSPHINPHWIYTWVYFFFFNILWTIIPSLLIWQSWEYLTTSVGRCLRSDAKKLK